MTESADVIRLTAGGTSATVSTCGAALRSVTVEGRPLVDHGVGDPVSQYRGSVLVPWPNRTQPVAWRTGDASGVLQPTPGFDGCAIHGLLATVHWRVTSATSSRVRLEATVEPSPGYGHRLQVVAEYAIRGDGVAVEFVVTNRGDEPAPVGLGWHPYLSVHGPLDEVIVHLDHDLVLEPDERSVPCRPVDALEVWGATPGGNLRGLVLDHSFRLRPGPEDRVVTIRDGERVVEMSFGANWPWVHLFTADSLAAADHRASLALEPMSCPANALQTGTDLVWLGSGTSQTWTAAIREVRPGRTTSSAARHRSARTDQRRSSKW